MDGESQVLGPEGLRRFQGLRGEAADAVTRRFYQDHASDYAEFGARGREACREDLAYHLEFLRPVLEFGLTQPLVDYLRWLSTVLATRGIPSHHLPQSLDWLAQFFAARMDPAEGALVAAALTGARARFLEASQAEPAIYAMMPAAWPQAEAFERALLAGHRGEARALLDTCLAAGDGLVNIEMHMIQPALYEIGRKWQENKVTVAQEHLATAISQAMMSHGLMQSPAIATNGKRVVLACVEGNHHAVGLQMVADAFQLGGWDVQFLGPDVPTAGLIGHLVDCRPDLLGLSVSFAHQLRTVKDVMARLEAAPGAARPAVIVGGLAINQFSPLASLLGVDASSPDAGAAVLRASKLPAHAHPG